MEILAISRVTVEGALAVVAAGILFFGSIFMLLAALFGARMGYLVTATGMFAFMLILSALWAFGAPCPGPCAPAGIPANLGPRGELPAWIVVAQGPSLSSEQVPV
ncbi:MAG TPA: hypothetical protein VE754_05330, partial [Actinomycetota bacterium]|nr:hypothetical protein [Actinomycetota bacterium]